MSRKKPGQSKAQRLAREGAMVMGWFYSSRNAVWQRIEEDRNARGKKREHRGQNIVVIKGWGYEKAESKHTRGGVGKVWTRTITGNNAVRKKKGHSYLVKGEPPAWEGNKHSRKGKSVANHAIQIARPD